MRRGCTTEFPCNLTAAAFEDQMSQWRLRKSLHVIDCLIETRCRILRGLSIASNQNTVLIDDAEQLTARRGQKLGDHAVIEHDPFGVGPRKAEQVLACAER